jgi:hypothetical protein
VTEETPVPAEKKSMFGALCGCLGGSAPPADTDAKEPPAKDAEEVEKEEVAEEKTEATPAEAEIAEA